MNPIIKKSQINSNPFEEKNIDVAVWLRFLKEQKIQQLFEKLPDPRQQSKIQYPISSLAMWALSVPAFRQSSKHSFQTTLDTLSSEEREGFLKLLGCQGKELPHSSTVDHALSGIDYEEFNKILMGQMDKLIKKKFFYNHQELLPDGALQIGVDGCWIHKYDHPHVVDKEGNNCCPYCLPRTQNKEAANEKTHFVHVLVTFTLITESFTIPIFVYPLKANQVNSMQNEKKLKQECELIAAKETLCKIRKRYPRLSITFLGDALYGNKPFIELCLSLKLDYMIVLKDNLKAVNRKCDELSTHPLYQNSYTLKKETTTASYFNCVAIDANVQTNVLRYKDQDYSGQWIMSKRISKGTCLRYAHIGRMRWDHEDVHNTCKNRGFELKHDMARACPNLLIVWKLIVFIAFSFFEIFKCTTLAIIHRKSRSLMKFAQDLLGQLVNKAWSIIANSPILKQKRVQFRYHFGPGP